MEPIVGIDLGTTNSEIAFIINESAQVIKEKDNGIVPSCVGINPAGQIVVGQEAKNQAVVEPDKTILSVKRLMGSDQPVYLDKKAYRPQEISAMILKALKERAERSLQTQISNAIITVPAYFADAQRQATREAGEIAGLNVIRILNEPTAAALAYESDQTQQQKILVYDLGGGTFDVSIVKIEEGVVEVLSSTGDSQLGGDDFDQKIIDLLMNHLKDQHHLDVSDDPQTMARLKRTAEAAKIELSSAPFVLIEEDHIGKKRLKDIHLTYELSRQTFEETIADDFQRTMEAVNKALDDAKCLAGDIDKIILVGGSTRIPVLSRLLAEKFGKMPHAEIDPDLCVALGSAIQGGREMGISSSKVLLDITPYTFGTSAVGDIGGQPVMDMFVPLIHRNSKLPFHHSKVFYTMYENQEAVDITVFQGENSHAYDNILIGKYKFDLSKAPANSPIILRFDLDINGILKIQGIEKKTDRQINAVIENAFASFTEGEIKQSKEKIELLWNSDRPEPEDSEISRPSSESDADADEDLNMPSDIKAVVKEAKQKLNQASIEDQEDIINLIEDIIDAVKSNQLDKLKDLKEELSDILFYIDE